MKRTEMLQAVRRMKFESVLDRWQRRQLSQAEAAEVLGMSERSFRRWRDCSHKKQAGRTRLLAHHMTIAPVLAPTPSYRT